MPNEVAWLKIEEWEFQKILKAIAEGTKTGIHTREEKNRGTASC
jgi:hypothetical protein